MKAVGQFDRRGKSASSRFVPRQHGRCWYYCYDSGSTMFRRPREPTRGKVIRVGKFTRELLIFATSNAFVRPLRHCPASDRSERPKYEQYEQHHEQGRHEPPLSRAWRAQSNTPQRRLDVRRLHFSVPIRKHADAGSMEGIQRYCSPHVRFACSGTVSKGWSGARCRRTGFRLL